MIFVTRRERIVHIELLVGVAEWDRPHFAIQRRASRVTAVVMPEGAARDGIDRGVPGRVALVIGTDDGIRIVLRRGTVVVRAGRPDSERRGVAGGGAIIGGRRTVLACQEDKE